MPQNLLYWSKLYERLKQDSLCLDIEVTGFNGAISVVGLYRPKDGVVECEQFVRGQNLSSENLKTAFDGCKMLVTYNGIKFDVPKIRQEFPGVVPERAPIIDLYRFARRLDLNTNLKVLENTLAVERMEGVSKKRRIAVRLWRRYVRCMDARALAMLLEYNKQDTVNLYPVAEKLVEMVYEKLGLKKRILLE